MPAHPRTSRDRDHAEYPSAILEWLLDGAQVPADTPPQVQELARLLAALRTPAAMDDITGEARATAAFVRGRSAAQDDAIPRRRRFVLATLLGSKLATAAAAGALTFGGAAAAAYTGALPEPIQDFAHEAVGAPAPDRGQARAGDAGGSQDAGQPASDGAVGPDATGPAKTGLCTAFAKETAERGHVDTHSVAFKALAEAAGGADKIDEFCADVTAGSAANRTPGRPTGKPSNIPANPPADPPPAHPTGPAVDPPGRD